MPLCIVYAVLLNSAIGKVRYNPLCPNAYLPSGTLLWYIVAMKKKRDGRASITKATNRVVALLPDDLAKDVRTTRAQHGVSISALVEASLRELLRRSDLTEVLKRHGAVARRTN